MRDQRRGWTWAVALVTALGTIGMALAPDRAEPAAPKKAADKKTIGNKKAGLRIRAGVPPEGANKNAADPLNANPTGWPFYYTLRIGGGEANQGLVASYYPSKLPDAPVLLLVHETGAGRSGKDFLTPIAGLKGQSFAEYLQDNEYAALILDLRGHGANPRRALGPKELPTMVPELQAAYLFLVDRHNHRELNLAKLGVIAIGDGANLAAAWAAGGGLSREGAVGDLGAMVLISPVADARGLRLSRELATLAPRVPLMIVSGRRNNDAVKEVEDLVGRHRRTSKIVYFETPLAGERLLNFVPGVPEAATKFLDDPIKFRTVEWEPRYLLNPVAFSHVQRITRDDAHAPAAAPGAEARARPKNAPARKDDAFKKDSAKP